MSVAEDSIRGQLEAAMKAQAEPEVETEVAETPAKVETSEAAATTAQERARDASGRFVSAGGSPQGVEGSTKEPAVRGVRDQEQSASVTAKGGVNGAAAVLDTTAVVRDADSVQPGAQSQALAPPNGWSAEAKAKWHELPSEIMAAVQKREADVAKFTSTRDEHASFGKEIYQTVQPYLATINAEGGTPATAIKALLNTAYVLRTGTAEHKRALILETARQFGVDLGQPAAKPNGQQPTNTAPEYQRLQQEIAELRGAMTQRETAEHQRLQTEVQTEIEAFAADPKNTHYQEVKAHMAALLREGAAKGLQDAYEQAVWARPDTRATLLAQQRAEEEQKRVAAARQKAQDAKRKNVSITGGPGNTAAGAAPGSRSLREELMAAQAELTGSV